MTPNPTPRLRAALALAAMGAVVAAPQLRAQDGFRGWEEIVDRSWRFDPDTHQFRSFQVAGAAPVREAIEDWETLRKEGAIVPALRALQGAIDDHGGSALQIAGDRYVGAAEYARWLIRAAPAEIGAAYSKLAEQNGRDALRRALGDRDLFALRIVARRFANAAVGQEALVALAELHRERGARALAACHARRALDFALAPLSGDEERSARLATRAAALLALAEGRGGEPRVDPAARIDVAGAPTAMSEVAAAGALAPPRVAVDEWPTYGGDPSRARHASEPGRPLDLDRAFDLPVEHARWADDRSPIRDMVHAAIQPIRLGDRLLVNNTLSVRCFDLLTRTQVWEYEGAQVEVQGREEDGFLSVEEFVPRNDHDDPTWSKALIAGLSAGQGVVLANLQVPLSTNVKSHQGFRINDPCPIRGLVALDAESGELLWEQRPLAKNRLTSRVERVERRTRGDPESVVPRLDVPAPPAILDDVAFALGHYFEGAVNTYVAALDLATGEPLWTTPLATGQQELSMFNMPFQEFTLGCPAYADGTLYCSTNVGVVAAVDVAFGDVRWVKEYKSLPILEPHNYFRNVPRPVCWYNRGALAGPDLALFTPHDSRLLLSLDPATGRERWSREFQSYETGYPSAQLVGVDGGRAVAAVSGGVIAFDLADGRVKWTWPDSTRGRGRPVELRATGVLADGHAWLPTVDELIVLDLADGHEVARRSWDASEATNLLVFPDLVVLAGQSAIHVAFDPVEALKELRLQLARGESLELLTRIGSLERQAGELEQAAATLARALELAANAAPADVARARAASCGALRELAVKYRIEGALPGWERSLVAAEALADDPQVRVDLVHELLLTVGRAPADDRAIAWLDRARRDFPSARVAVGDLSARPVALALWAGFELAARRMARGEWEAALAELQRLQVDQPAEALDAGDSVAVAQERVEALFRAAPPSLRQQYDAEAERSFAAAVAAHDVERLALLLRRFPSARTAPAYATKELELLREAQRPIDALVVGGDLLRSGASGELARAATIELARGARELRNESLARALVARLTKDAEVALPDDLRPFVAAAPHEEPASGKLELVKAVELPPATVLLGGVDRPLRGEPLPAGFDSLLAFEQSFDVSVARLALPSGEEKWRRTLRSPRNLPFALIFVHVGGVLVVRRGSLLVGIDLETGEELWWDELERDAQELSAASGILLVTQRTPPTPQAQEEPEPVELLLIEPRTGRRLATVGCSGSDTSTRGVVGVGGVALVTTFGRRGQVVEAFDAITGVRRLDAKPSPVGLALPLYLPAQELLVLPDTRPNPGDPPTQKGVLRVVAWRLDEDVKAWEFDLLPLAFSLKTTYLTAGGLALLGGPQRDPAIVLLDPESGKPAGDVVPLPPGADSIGRILVQGDEAAVRVQGYFEWPRGGAVTVQLVAGDGRLMWRKELEVPKGTVQPYPPQRMLRRGGALLLQLQYTAGSKARAELVVLDEASGQLLEREAFEGGGRTEKRDDLVRSGEWVALRQESTLRVLAWR